MSAFKSLRSILNSKKDLVGNFHVRDSPGLRGLLAVHRTNSMHIYPEIDIFATIVSHPLYFLSQNPPAHN